MLQCSDIRTVVCFWFMDQDLLCKGLQTGNMM